MVVGPELALPRVTYSPAKVSPIFTNDNPNTVTIQCDFDLVDTNFFLLRWQNNALNILATRTASSITVEPGVSITENTWNLATTIPSTHKIDYKVTLCDKDNYRCRVGDNANVLQDSVLEPLEFDGKYSYSHYD